MALFEIVEGEYDEQFTGMGRFVRRIPASGGCSTACVSGSRRDINRKTPRNSSDLVARLTGEQK
jgi:hypothetical protein